VSVVVVVVGPGIVVEDDVVVELCVASEAQPEKSMWAETATQARMICFIGVLLVVLMVS